MCGGFHSCDQGHKPRNYRSILVSVIVYVVFQNIHGIPQHQRVQVLQIPLWLMLPMLKLLYIDFFNALIFVDSGWNHLRLNLWNLVNPDWT